MQFSSRIQTVMIAHFHQMPTMEAFLCPIGLPLRRNSVHNLQAQNIRTLILFAVTGSNIAVNVVIFSPKHDLDSHGKK